ncbi:predicted protein [Naegleria gruberi]|uniref:Predicted protein n=1 Tax=Naegleria gruberi TaxID=5762 RepID=D2VXY8_NAEGR|nr:uncharacterized protein NAEGRDRAFT_74006 [Naegleria gruberi]EFC38321.1 predicted protein [Naegleria gruberi]|eukprot:XP_002671065.1 predicted protein [Naegleria gruberi strain NEG-M]
MATKAKLNRPFSVFVHSEQDMNQCDEVYIADTENHCIRKIINGNIITIAGTGEAGFNGDNIKATQATINKPVCVIVNHRNGNVYFSDLGNNRIRKIDNNGIISTIVGCGDYGLVGDGNLAINSFLNSPRGICLSNDGNYLYIADRDNHAIRKVSLNDDDDNGLIETIVGNGSSGESENGSLALNSQINCPYGIAISKDDELYFSEFSNHTIRKIDKNGKLWKVAGIDGKNGNNEYDHHAFNNLLNYPAYICFDNNNNLYIADRDNNSIRKIDLKTGLINTAVVKELNSPLGCFVTINNILYIADTDNHQIKMIDLNNEIITITAGTGEEGYSGDYILPTNLNI